jgi:hypothetical protein
LRWDGKLALAFAAFTPSTALMPKTSFRKNSDSLRFEVVFSEMLTEPKPINFLTP